MIGKNTFCDVGPDVLTTALSSKTAGQTCSTILHQEPSFWRKRTVLLPVCPQMCERTCSSCHEHARVARPAHCGPRFLTVGSTKQSVTALRWRIPSQSPMQTLQTNRCSQSQVEEMSILSLRRMNVVVPRTAACSARLKPKTWL
jgi:hypothetical protein